MIEPKNYPVSSGYKVIDAYDIHRSPDLIIAIVVVESERGKDIRLYRWQKRKEQWKVDLCRMSISRWNVEEIFLKVSEFKSRYGFNKLN